MTARRSWPFWLLLIGAAVLALLIPSGASAATDDDGDGIVNTSDKCIKTPKGEAVDELGCSASQDGDNDGVRDGSDKCLDTPKGTTVGNDGCTKKAVSKPMSCSPNKAIAAALGVKTSDLWVGKAVDWDATPETEPQNEFSGSERRTKAALTRFLNADGDGSHETRKLLDSALTDKEYKRALAGKGFIAAQLKGGDNVQLKGNYQHIGGDAVERSSVSQPSEVFWVYVPTSCDGSKAAIKVALRAWCGNPVLFAKP